MNILTHKNFLRYYFLSLLNPEKAFQKILKQRARKKFALICVAGTAVLYTLMYVLLSLADGAPSTFTPWLNIQKEDYYFYNQFLLAPSLFLGWVLAAGFVQLVSHAFNGKGTFEGTFVLIGISISISMWPTLVHDLSTSFLSAIHVLNAAEHELAMNSPSIWRTILWICMGFYLLLFLFLFTKSVKASQDLSLPKSALIGVSGSIIFQTFFLIFNR